MAGFFVPAPWLIGGHRMAGQFAVPLRIGIHEKISTREGCGFYEKLRLQNPMDAPR